MNDISLIGVNKVDESAWPGPITRAGGIKMQVCDKKTFAYDQIGNKPFLMENANDDTDVGIGAVETTPFFPTAYESSGDPARLERRDLKSLVAYLIQPEDSTDDGRICEGSRGAYESRTLLGTIKAFMWIAAGIVTSMLVAQLL